MNTTKKVFHRQINLLNKTKKKQKIQLSIYEKDKEDDYNPICAISILEEPVKCENNTIKSNFKYVYVVKSIYKHFQKIYVHFYALTMFEICFYFYFVVPFEKRIIGSLFTGLIPTNTIQIQNTTITIKNVLTLIDTTNCVAYMRKINTNNMRLFWNAMKYIIGSSLLLLTLFLIDVINYIYLKQKNDLEETDYSTTIVKKEKLYCKHDFCMYSIVLRECRATLSFLCIIVIFEYMFFVNIVEKYVVANAKTIICEMI
jgi:hypothetical protein